MNPLLSQFITALLRWVLTGVGAWFVQRGILDGQQVTEMIAGATLAIVALIWSLWNKYRSKILLFTFGAMRPGTTLDEAKSAIANGMQASAGTGSGDVPRLVDTNPDSVKPRLGAWLLPLLLIGGLASACGGLTPAPVTPNPVKVTTEKALQIATAVEKGSALVVQVARATAEASTAKLITLEQRDAVLTAIIRIEPHAKDAPTAAHVLCASAFIDAIHAATTEPALRGAVQALMDLVNPLIASLPPALAQWVDTLRLAYQVASAYLGGGL